MSTQANALYGLAGAALGGLGQSSGASRDRKVAVEYLAGGRKTARQDLKPFQQIGQAALTRGATDLMTRRPGIGYAGFQYGGQQPGYAQRGNTRLPGVGDLQRFRSNAPLPRYQSQGDFEFNLESDPGYLFARDEALRGVERAMAARGMNRSGNVLNELANRASGLAAQHTDAAFNRQLAADRENYGRGVTDYGIRADRGREQFGRDLTRNQLARERQNMLYGRGVDRANTLYGRGVTDYGIARAAEADAYNRGVQQYGLDVARDQDLYSRQQNHLAQLLGLGQMGHQAATQRANAAQQAAGSMANVRAGGALANQQGNQFMAQSIGNALAGFQHNQDFDRLLNMLNRRGGVGASGR